MLESTQPLCIPAGISPVKFAFFIYVLNNFSNIIFTYKTKSELTLLPLQRKNLMLG